MADGFFNISDIAVVRGDERTTTHQTIRRTLTCEDCKRHAECISPEMPLQGDGRKGIMIIFDSPNSSDAMYNKYFAPFDYSDALKKVLATKGIVVGRDCWTTSAVRCYSKKEITHKNIQACASKLRRDIEECKPKVIIVVGEYAFNSLTYDKLSGRANVGAYSAWVGGQIPDQDYKAWLCPIYSRDDIMIHEKDGALQMIWENHIRSAVNLLDEEFPIMKWEDHIETTTNEQQAIRWLRWASKQSRIAFDYEATGIKPQRDWHTITTISVANKDIGYSFPYFDTDEFKQAFKEFLLSDTAKIAHNEDYEAQWSYEFAGVWPKNWYFDTMIAEHCLQNKKPINLKFLVYSYFGVVGYDNGIEPYIKASEEDEKLYGNNAKNKMEEAPLEEQLKYNAGDSYFTYLIYMKQKHSMNAHIKSGFDFFMESRQMVSEIQAYGMRTDESKVEGLVENLQSQLATTLDKIKNDPVLAKWKAVRPFTFSSNDDMQILVYDILKTPLTKKTPGGGKSTDKKVLGEIDHPIIKNILAYKRIDTALNRYVSQFKREVNNGLIHASINLTSADTFRSSISGPSLQNLPKRDKEIMEYVRGLVVPRIGNRIIDYDFKGVEVCIAACYTQDKNLINYVTDYENTDMHRDSAMDLFMLDKGSVSKELRYIGKNKFVFPEFYGSYYRNIAPDIWNSIPQSIKQHLKNNGVRDYMDFESHVKEIEDHFWNVRFPEYKAWRGEQWDRYCADGYIDSLTGFRYHHPMDRKTVVNYPIQGCLAGESKVLTKEGLIPIKNLIGVTTEVWTGFKWAKAFGLNKGVWKRAEIELDSGLIIKCDTRHKLKNDKNEWVNFDNLKPNDYVALPRLLKTVEFSKQINWWFVFGFIVGDGCISNKSRKVVTIVGGKTKEYILQNIYKFLLNNGYNKSYGGVHYYEVLTKGKETKYKVEIQSKVFAKYLESYGFVFGATAHTKRLPTSVWQATTQQQRDFLEGLWLSDGSRGKDDKYSLSMCNKELLEEIQLLSSCVGFDSYLRKIPTGHKLSFSWNKFNNKTCRRYPIKAITSQVQRIGFSNYEKRNEYTTDKRCFNMGKDISQYVAERIIEKNTETPIIYRYDKIKKITILAKEEETFTMSVDDPLHQFVADGVITKNSAFHVLLWTMNQVHPLLKTTPRSKFITEIHDDQVGDIHPEDEDQVDAWIKFYGTQKVREHWDWITVPLMIEKERSAIDGDWAHMKSCGYI